MDTQPELLDYVAFFEAEAKILHPDVGWSCGAQFDSVRGEDRIRAVVAPAEGHFQFNWWSAGVSRAAFDIAGVVKWVLECKPGEERLLLKFHQPGIEYFIVQLRPHIGIQAVVQWA